jgi:hypothetical protein
MQRSSLDEVHEAFATFSRSSAWTRVHDLLDMADVAGVRWFRHDLSHAEILRVWLPHHVHSGEEVVPPSGQRIADVLDNRFLPGVCTDHMEHFCGPDYGPVILTDFVLRDADRRDGYDEIRPKNGDWIHLDGLHRMLQWARSHASGTLPVFLARRNLH